jgi:hypothetical protein
MKAMSLTTALGLCLALGVPSISSAQQPQKQPSQPQPPRTATKPARKSATGKATVQQSTAARSLDQSGERPSGSLTPPINDDDHFGDNFTSSSQRSITRDGEIGLETGSGGSDVNGQIGTSNQGNLVHGTMGGGLFTFHFGGGGSHKKSTLREHRSPRQKEQADKAPQADRANHNKDQKAPAATNL